MSYANVRRGRLRKHLRWLPVTLAQATLPHRSCVSRAVRKGRPLCFTPRAPAGAYGAAAFRAPSNSTSAARPAGRARTPRTALPPAAAAAAPVGSTTAPSMASSSAATHPPPSALRPPRTHAPRPALRQLPAAGVPPLLVSHQRLPADIARRLWIGSVRWLFAWRPPTA